jgi:hypothetical protein
VTSTGRLQPKTTPWQEVLPNRRYSGSRARFLRFHCEVYCGSIVSMTAARSPLATLMTLWIGLYPVSVISTM